MKIQYTLVAILFSVSNLVAGGLTDWSTGKTFRFDFFHSGSAGIEKISQDEIRLEGNWAGSETILVENFDLGLYKAELREKESGKLLFSAGFSSIFGEWQTTGEASAGKWKTFHESVRFPEPKTDSKLIISKRNPDASFLQLAEFDIQPNSRFINRSIIPQKGKVIDWMVSGPQNQKVDIVILADGYTADQLSKFKSDVDRLAGYMFSVEPYKSRKTDFNVRLIFASSEQEGISNPRKDQWMNNLLGFRFNAFDSDRYVLSFENKTIRELAAQVPYDAVIVVCNSKKYGGGGIYNLYASVTSDTEPSTYVFTHEFGHSFASLGDEYYTSDVAYELSSQQKYEPQEPNITALLDKSALKWKEFVNPGTPLPTPWKKAEFEQISIDIQKRRTELTANKAADSTMNKLFREDKNKTEAHLKAERFYGQTGAFEGAGYESHGLYRPELDCIMFSRNPDHFCKVCTKAINHAIDRYTY
ncbi:MAG: IgA Peptidase M64 [Bacteroidetes bacterium]|nr:IgA Peptidase M64 [Bacteroidota bacterium]